MGEMPNQAELSIQEAPSVGPWCNAGGGESTDLLCQLLVEPLQKLLQAEANRPIVVVLFSVDQCPDHHSPHSASSLEEGSIITGTIRIQQFTREEGIAPRAILLEHHNGDHLTHNNNPSSGINGSKLRLQLVLEGFENTLVEYERGHAFPTNTGFDGAVRATHKFLHKVYELNHAEGNLVAEGDSLRFSIQLPLGNAHSMPAWSDRKFPRHKDPGGECSVSYQIKALVQIPKQQQHSEHGDSSLASHHCLQSVAVPLTIPKKPVECPSGLSFVIGPPVTIPETALCGLYTYAYRDSFSFQLDDESLKKTQLNLFPGQKLQIVLDDSTGKWRNKASKTVWKLTQRIRCTCTDQFETRGTFDFLNSWEQTLPVVDGGVIQVPSLNGALRMTHMGKTIQARHEMVVFTYDKKNVLLATSTQIAVNLTSGYVL